MYKALYKKMYAMYCWAYTSQKCNIFETSAQRKYVGAQLYWAKEITADDDSDPQGKVKRTRNNKKVSIEQALNIYCFPFFSKLLKKSQKYNMQ